VFVCAFDRVLQEGHRQAKPDIVLCVGWPAVAASFAWKRVGINVQDARIRTMTAAADRQAGGEGWPRGAFRDPAIKACVAAMRQAGLAAAVVEPAGTFSATHILYALIDIGEPPSDAAARGFPATYPMPGADRQGRHRAVDGRSPTSQRGIEIIPARECGAHRRHPYRRGQGLLVPRQG